MALAHAKKDTGPKHPAILSADNAPTDNEPVTEADLEAIEEGLRERRADKRIPHDEVRRRWLERP
jgi:hypothetical protein